MVVSFIATFLYWGVWLFTIFLWARLVVDLIRSMRPGWRPGQLMLVISGVVFTVTDPPMRAVRRVIKPVSFGAVALDFGWTALMLAAIVVMYILEFFM